MFARVTCPACQYKFSIPEGDMGKRHVCPNCQSPFFAGSSVAETAAVGAASAAIQPAPGAAPGPGYAKTMLGESAGLIKYNCPRCKAPLEAPASEAGVKKPCPACGQRLQVPAAPPPPVTAPPNLNKTMLASDESKAAPIKYNCPNCKRPLEALASEAGVKKNCPFCSQRLQVPAASPATSGLNKTILATDESRGHPAGAPVGYATSAAPGAAPAAAPAATMVTPRNVAIAAGILFLLVFVVPAVIRGGAREDAAALAKAQQEFEKAKLEFEQRKADADRLTRFEENVRQQLKDLTKSLYDREERMREDHFRTLASIEDENAKAKLKAKYEQDRAELAREKREMEAKQQRILEETKAKLDESKRALEQAQQSQQRQQTIIQQPPVIYYPPYHPRYYWWW
ncbi:MAG: hypothetical protein L0Y71_14785 [Gemmataceae bacterium]|nr:hypothetical protein [Gemmataceae bacterium]